MSGLFTYISYKINAHTYIEMYFEHLPHESISTSSCQTGWPSPRGAAEAHGDHPREANRLWQPNRGPSVERAGMRRVCGYRKTLGTELRLSPHRS